jgi:hypothetical protein
VGAALHPARLTDPQWLALRIGHSPDPSSPTLRLTPVAMTGILGRCQGHEPSTRLTARIGVEITAHMRGQSAVLIREQLRENLKGLDIRAPALPADAPTSLPVPSARCSSVHPMR